MKTYLIISCLISNPMNIFIPIKENSQRVSRKNFRPFRGKPLWKHTIDKVREEYPIYIDTDSEEIINECLDLDNVTAYKRDPDLLGDTTSVVDLIKRFRKHYQITDCICQIHVTSPFLQLNHIKIAEQKLQEGYDSVFGVDVLQQRLWRKENYGYCPINHNPMKLQQTQDLPKYYCENSYLYAFNSQVLDQNNRIGNNPYLLEVGFPYNLDIDTEQDWSIIEHISQINQKDI
jgi:CMP-N-acetylneuraminic acid synthetase